MSKATPTVDNFQFLETIFSGFKPDEETPVVCAFPEPPEERETSGKGWPSYAPADPSIARRIGKQGADNNTYYCISTVALPEPGEKLNRQHKNLTGTYVFPLDDIGTGAGAKYTPESVPLPPSAIIETSKDNYQYLYFPSEPVRDVAKAQALLAGMVAGHGDSGASIAAKYVRLPVGHNNKKSRCVDGQPFPVTLTEWHPERRYTIDELVDAFELDEEELSRQRRRLDRRRLALMGPLPSQSDPIHSWLVDEQWAEGSEPDGRGFLQVRCPWAHEHSTGGDTAGYSPLGYGDEFAPVRQFKCLHDHCSDRDATDFLQWVVEQGGPDLTEKSLETFLERYVFISNGPLVYDRRTQTTLSLKAFHDTNANHFYTIRNQRGSSTKVYLSKEWQGSPQRTTVHDQTFIPRDQEIVTVGLAQYLNTFKPTRRSGVTESTDRIMPVLQHIRYLFPEKEDAERMLDFLAATVCRPEERLQYALLHISQHHGTGRGWLKEMTRRLLGKNYVKDGHIDGLINGSGFNEYLHESLLVCFDEVFEGGSGRYRLMDRLREMITENRVNVNVKYGYKGDTDVFSNVMMFSNHTNAINLTASDRRMWIVINQAEPQSPEYYNRLWALLDDPEAINQLYWFLHRRAPSVNVGDRAPQSEARGLIIDEGRDEFAQTVHDVLDVLKTSSVKVVWNAQLEAIVKAAGIDLGLDRQGHEYKRLRSIVREWGAVPCGQMRIPPEQQGRFNCRHFKNSAYALVPVPRANARELAIETGNRPELYGKHNPLNPLKPV